MEFAKTSELQTRPYLHMSSCPTPALSRILTARPVPLADLTVRDHSRLLDALDEVPDPRDPRGVQYRLASLLAVAVCAVISGAVTYAAISDWLDDLPDTDLPLLGLLRRPAATTVWRLLVRVDSVTLTQVMARWLLTRTTPCDGTRDDDATPRVIGFDGKTVRGTVQPDMTCTHLLSAYDVATGITLAQVPLQAKGGEIAQVKPLVEQVEAVIGTVAGCVFVADALHAQKIHTVDLTGRGAALLVRAKANQPTLFDRLRSLPWAAAPVGDRTRDHGHGRDETRTCKALTVTLPGGLGFPHAAQAVRITRTRRVNETAKTTRKTERETAYGSMAGIKQNRIGA
jgi:hypothetical protein